MEAIPGADSSLAIMVHRVWCVEVGRRSISPRHREHIYSLAAALGGQPIHRARPAASREAHVPAGARNREDDGVQRRSDLGEDTIQKKLASGIDDTHLMTFQ